MEGRYIELKGTLARVNLISTMVAHLEKITRRSINLNTGTPGANYELPRNRKQVLRCQR